MADPAPQVSEADVDALVTGATPQFALQIAERLRALIAPLQVGDAVRHYGELQLTVLDRIALGTTRGVRAPGVPAAESAGWRSMPSRPPGGIAPGADSGGH